MATKYTYDKKKDYQAMINEAVDTGDYQSAALYEQQRNQKIADMNAAGTNTKNHQQTDLYSKYLNGGTDTAQGYLSALASGTKSGDSENYGAWKNALDQYANSKFEYDFDADPQKATYEKNAQDNFNNTLAQISSRTGGLASSYAGQASQQAYQSTMSDAYQILYNLARSDYDADQQKQLNLANQYWNAYQSDLDLSNTNWDRLYSLYGLTNSQESTAAANEKESALMAAYGGDYARLAAAYGITEEQAKAYLNAASGTSSGGSGGSGSSGSTNSTGTDGTSWVSAREKLYQAGVDKDDAYNWLVDAGYSTTEAKEIAAGYSDQWKYERGQKDGVNLGVAARRVLSMIDEGILTDEEQAKRIIEYSSAMSDTEKSYLLSLIAD